MIARDRTRAVERDRRERSPRGRSSCMRDRRSRSRRAGFTILEILVALAILLLGMTAVLGLLTFGATLSRTALLRTTAASAAEGVLADLEERMFPLENGEAGPPIQIVDRALPGVPDVVYSARATENPDDPLEYRVDVEMAWKTAGVRRARRFSALLLREVPFGERFRSAYYESADDRAPAPAASAPPAK